jgi:hypothetical protein
MARKRLHVHRSNIQSSRSHSPPPPSPGPDAQTVKEQAQSYLLGTLPIHVDSLSAEWAKQFGSNRSINSRHVQDLVEQFQAYGVHRTSVENRLQVSCSLSDWHVIRDHYLAVWKLNKDSTPAHITNNRSRRSNDLFSQLSADQRGTLFSTKPACPPDQIPVIGDWFHVTSHHLELLAGQHRVAALRAHLRATVSSRSAIDQQLWWMCDVYNQSKSLGFISLSLSLSLFFSLVMDMLSWLIHLILLLWALPDLKMKHRLASFSVESTAAAQQSHPSTPRHRWRSLDDPGPTYPS